MVCSSQGDVETEFQDSSKYFKYWNRHQSEVEIIKVCVDI